VRETEFRTWLADSGKRPPAISRHISDVRRVETDSGDLDAVYQQDRCRGLLAQLAYSRADRQADTSNPTSIVVEGDLFKALASMRSTISSYVQFRDSCNDSADISIADRIRVYVGDQKLGPAIASREPSIAVRAGDVHQALGLDRNWRNVCQALQGRKLLRVFNLPEPQTEGAADSTATIFTYDLTWLQLDRELLERYRALFLARYPRFESFQQQATQYFQKERQYKEDLIEHARLAITNIAGDAELGARLLDLVTAKVVDKSDLLGWRTNDHVTAIRGRHPGILEVAAAQLARAEDLNAGIASFVNASWPLIAENQISLPYSESRNLPTMLAALVRPDQAYGINTEPVKKSASALVGYELFGANPMTTPEYRAVMEMAQCIRDVMKNEWNWAPRDFWDVQGFVWAVHQKPDVANPPLASAAHELDEKVPMSKNLILYGPPGTGKTYRTAEEAVRLCGEAVPADRQELMATYQRLHAAGRIEFVTFHQSTAYEDFIEGLRPSQVTEEGKVGFELTAKLGIFRLIARRAETSTGPGIADFSLTGRRVYKMSIGEAANPDDAHLFEEAIAGSYTLLGFDDIDWTDNRFADVKEILDVVQKGEKSRGEPPTAMSGRIQMPYYFRNALKPGDLIVVSRGNSLFRAIGEITGTYQFVPRDGGTYSHRRAVRWLWIDRAGVPVSEIYARNFTQKSIYLLSQADLKEAALTRYMSSQQDGDEGNPESFVLIIDEINRANISKVFGELITLLEPDKRLGQPQELTVRLPYSGEVFGVPSNLHIIGTMNTADRSIALLDTALRRRFEFRELMPDATLLRPVDGIDLSALLATINERIEYLFDREHQIGHAYFISCRSRGDVDEVMRHKIIPLLTEYFYEDWAKVAAVLGDGDDGEGDRDGHFLERRRLRAPTGLSTEDDAAPRYRWSIRKEFAYDGFRAA
jgi:5-methylcytosine-specific restriction protein B